jgi:hypothetical protein
VKIERVPFRAINWSAIAVTEHPGETGVARWRTVEQGNLRVRMVDYSPGYVAGGFGDPSSRGVCGRVLSVA